MKSYVKIFTAPDNLSITIGERQDKKGAWVMVIAQGGLYEKHQFMDIFSTNIEQSFTQEQAIEQLEQVLKDSQKIGRKVLFSTEEPKEDEKFVTGLMRKIYECKDLSEEEYSKKNAPVLTDGDIEKIMQEVRKKQNCETYAGKWQDYWETRFPGWREMVGLPPKVSKKIENPPIQPA